MSHDVVRVLLVADTHLGFDLPFRPRVERRRRGPDFFANFEAALAPALAGQVDLLVHGGDLFFRSRVPPALVEMAMAPLIRVADSGTPVYLVPGNHERSRIPLHLWTAHPNIHIFDEPRTFTWRSARGTIALAGFPFARRIRGRFSDLVERTGHARAEADARLLCIHQAVEGAQVGASNYTFRGGVDVVRGRDIPGGFAACLSGHIHRAQVLRHDLGGRALAAPVVYPGAIERTSFAERDEEKGYMVVSIKLRRDGRQEAAETDFVPLPTRPMVSLVLEPARVGGDGLETWLKAQIAALDPDSVVRVQVKGPGSEEALRLISAAYLRELAPPSMNIALAPLRSGGVMGRR
jgi:DNA repair exonuclease SbcCD nuclease subunit